MAVNVVMKRTPKSGAMGKLTTILQELRQLATSQPGYISGETLYSAFNSGSTLVVSKWMSLQHWQEYENCPERRALLDRLEPLLDEPTTTEVYADSPVPESPLPGGRGALSRDRRCV